MLNKEKWSESKFVIRKGVLRSSRNSKFVSPSSRLSVNLIATFYQDTLSKFSSGFLLDLGCGNVPLFKAYEPYVEDNFCVDWQNSMHENNFLDLSADLNSILPLESETFDTIILSDVIEHIKNPKILWKELNRVLKKGGKIILNTPFYYWIHEEPFDYYRHTRFALKEAAEDNGFKIIRLEALGGAFEVLTDINAKVLKYIPVVGKPIGLFIQGITFWFGQTKIGQKIKDKTAKKFPFSYGMVIQKL